MATWPNTAESEPGVTGIISLNSLNSSYPPPTMSGPSCLPRRVSLQIAMSVETHGAHFLPFLYIV